MAIPPIKSEHIVSTEHFVASIIEEFLDRADLKHLLDVDLFKAPKKFPVADKKSQGSMTGLIMIRIDVLPDVRIVLCILGECLGVEVLSDVSFGCYVEDEQT